MASPQEPRTPGADDQMVEPPQQDKVKVVPPFKDLDARFGPLLAPILRVYYRYTLMTGVYMLGTVETGILHLAFLLGAYFLYTYFWSFARELGNWLPSLKQLGK